jgi:hypothetical protein
MHASSASIVRAPASALLNTEFTSRAPRSDSLKPLGEYTKSGNRPRLPAIVTRPNPMLSSF